MSGSGQALASARVDRVGDRGLDVALQPLELVVGELGVLAHPGLEAAHRILLGPAGDELWRHVGGVVVHGVALHAHRHQLEHRRAAARTRPLDRSARLAVDREHVRAVDDDALEAVGRPAAASEVDAKLRWVGVE